MAAGITLSLQQLVPHYYSGQIAPVRQNQAAGCPAIDLNIYSIAPNRIVHVFAQPALNAKSPGIGQGFLRKRRKYQTDVII